MGTVVILRPDYAEDLKPGHNILISKRVRITGTGPGSFVRGAGKGKQHDITYNLNEWDWEITTPAEWPPVPGDVWESKGIRYAAIQRGDRVVLQPMTSEMAVPVYPEDSERFLSDHPVIVLRS